MIWGPESPFFYSFLCYISEVDRAAHAPVVNTTLLQLMTCSFIVGALVVLLFPVIFILWLTESKQQRAKRWRKSGQTYASIASRLNVSPTTARRYCLA